MNEEVLKRQMHVLR